MYFLYISAASISNIYISNLQKWIKPVLWWKSSFVSYLSSIVHVLMIETGQGWHISIFVLFPRLYLIWFQPFVYKHDTGNGRDLCFLANWPKNKNNAIQIQPTLSGIHGDWRKSFYIPWENLTDVGSKTIENKEIRTHLNPWNFVSISYGVKAKAWTPSILNKSFWPKRNSHVILSLS